MVDGSLRREAPWRGPVPATPSQLHRVPHPSATPSPSRERSSTCSPTLLSKAWGHKAVDIGAGGTIPFLFDLAELFPKAEIMVTGVEDPRSGAHGPDESVDLAELERACLAEALFLERFAKR